MRQGMSGAVRGAAILLSVEGNPRVVPLLTKLACRAFAVVVLIAGVVVGVHTGLLADEPSPDPRQSVADDLRAADVDAQATRDWHREYALLAADEDAEEKAAGIAQVAADQAKALDDTYQANQDAEEEESLAPPDLGPIPADCDEYSGNKAAGCARLLDAGFGLDQMPCLAELWDHESGWNERAANGSGAYGIPQALPGSKMASVADDWETNPNTQIIWGLGYISGRYGTPCDALSYWQNNGFY